MSDGYTRGEDVLVLGGDCRIELGTVAGALADGSSVGLIYIDLDGDLLHMLASRVRQIPQWAGLTLCEVNPDHARDVAGQFTRLVSMLHDAV